ncbi:hypothetical protein DFH27DRAFT_607714 [Peziza echinospora]|nr:hypothetical protein DFH27DRAFT_607714 [Peziza echinospora]
MDLVEMILEGAENTETSLDSPDDIEFETLRLQHLVKKYQASLNELAVLDQHAAMTGTLAEGYGNPVVGSVCPRHRRVLPIILDRRYKTSLCEKFARNGTYCPYGRKCQFAHGVKELRQSLL